MIRREWKSPRKSAVAACPTSLPFSGTRRAMANTRSPSAIKNAASKHTSFAFAKQSSILRLLPLVLFHVPLELAFQRSKAGGVLQNWFGGFQVGAMEAGVFEDVAGHELRIGRRELIRASRKFLLETSHFDVMKRIAFAG